MTTIVVTYNNERQIADCLRSLDADPATAGGIIVLDNASADATAQVVERSFPHVELIRSADNLGFGRACNMAAARSRADHVAFVNPDAVLQGDAISQLLAYAQRRPEGGIYGGRTLRPSGEPGMESCFAPPSIWGAFCFGTGLLTAFPRTRFDPESLGRWNRDSEREVGVVTGLLMLVKRDLWERLGGFDDDFFMYAEDVDISIRAAQLGFRPCITPNAVVVHESGASAPSTGAGRVLLLTGRVTFMRKHWSPLRRRIGSTLLLMGVGLRAAAGADGWRVAWRARRQWMRGYRAPARAVRRRRARRGGRVTLAAVPAASRPMRVAIVVSFLNEERYLPTFLASIAGQTRPPDELLLVDDGSTDASAQIAEAFAHEHAYARALRRPRRPAARDRLAGAAVVASFEWGLAQLEQEPDVVAKMDADLDLTPSLVAAVERALLADPQLGVVGSYLCVEDGDGRRREFNPADHVRGPNKFYRWTCFADISPLAPHLGWDTVDEVRARMHGWRSRSIELPEGDPLHMRPTGLQDGRLRAFRRWGTCAWCFGQHPLIVVAGGFTRILERPYVVGGVNYVAGWAIAGLRRTQRVEPEVRAFVRAEKLRQARAYVRRPSRALLRRS